MMYGAHASYYKQPIKTHASPNQPQFRPVLRLTNTDIQQALYYFYQKATAEVDAFVPADPIRKHMYRQGGILYHRSRISSTGGSERHSSATTS